MVFASLCRCESHLILLIVVVGIVVAVVLQTLIRLPSPLMPMLLIPPLFRNPTPIGTVLAGDRASKRTLRGLASSSAGYHF